MTRTGGLVLAVALALVQGAADHVRLDAEPIDVPPVLDETPHEPVSLHLGDYWLVPDASERAALLSDGVTTQAVRGLLLAETGRGADALPVLRAVPDAHALGAHARLAEARIHLESGRLEESDAVLRRLAASRLVGLAAQETALRLSDVAIARGTAAEAEPLVRALAQGPLSAPADVWLKLGLLEEAAGHGPHAIEALRHVYGRWPASGAAGVAGERLAASGALTIDTPAALAAERQRAELLFSARQWTDARAAFASVLPRVDGVDRDLVALRLAQCDYQQKRYAAARAALQLLFVSPRYGAEARYFDLLAARDMGQRVSALALARELVAAEPDSDWAAEALNAVATEYIRGDDDPAAEEAFRLLLSRYPRHRHAERAGWRVGWWAYRRGDYAEALQRFERAAATFPRADTRPAWIYWAGRARERLGDAEMAATRYRLVVADYGNSYYGRLAAERLAARRQPSTGGAVLVARAGTADDVPSEPIIRVLLAGGLTTLALQEVQFAQRAWGDTPRLLATAAWLRHRQAEGLTGMERFTALRGAITTMRRAYPRFMAAGGEQLPPELLRVIFPLDYWPLLTKYAALHELDPYLVAALVAQESTFTAEIRSSANAYGLMQVIPATGRTVARKIGLRRFSVAMLRQPETNVRIGTQYFKDLLTRFGGAHFALAGYNAGPHRVSAWRAEAPDLPADEFVDNIPFAETQTYVKRILGTADDYRRLYGEGRLDPLAGLAAEGFPSLLTPPGGDAVPASPGSPRRASSRR